MFVPNIKRPAKPSHFLFTATQNDAIKKSETTPPQTAGKRDRINLAVTNFFIRSPARHRRLTTTRRTGRDYEIFYHALNSLSRQKNPYFLWKTIFFIHPSEPLLILTFTAFAWASRCSISARILTSGAAFLRASGE